MQFNMQRTILETVVPMPDLFVSNLNDERTCEYCMVQIGKMADDLEECPPFEKCENPDGCRCFYAVEKEM